VDARVVQDHHGDPPALPGALGGAAQLRTQRRRAAAVGQFEVQMAVAPVDQPRAVLLKAVLLVVLAGRLDQPLPGPASPGPDPGQGRVLGDLDLVLQVQVRALQQAQQARQVLGEQLVGQGGIGNQSVCGWRQR
jgi:hypothetical protein